METLLTIVAIATLLGSATVGGVFFAFSSFVMPALARRPAAEGIAAMQSINVVVLNRSFLGVFLGTAALSAGMVAIALADFGSTSAWLFLAGGIAYFAGTFLVTGLGNVPLNDRLKAIVATADGARQFWRHYVDRWTKLNHLRTLAATAAALLHVLGLLEAAAG